MRLPEFNSLVNQNNEKCFYFKNNRTKSPLMTMSDMGAYLKTAQLKGMQPGFVYWKITKGFYVLSVDSVALVNVIKDRDEAVIVVKDDIENKYYIICKGTYTKITENNILACGINADTIAYTSQSGIITPFGIKPFLPPSINLIAIEHYRIDMTIEEPFWLRPLRRVSNTTKDGFTVPIMNNTLNALSSHISKLTLFNKFELYDTISLINKEFCTYPISEQEIDALIEQATIQRASMFFEKGVFLHYRLGDLVIDECNIKMDEITHELYYFNKDKKIYISDDNFIKSYITKLCPQLKDFQKEETVKYIKSTLYGRTYRFNENPYTIVFKNGILNIDTMQFEEMTPEYLESIQINCNYNHNAYSKTADEFFSTATRGNKDTELLLYQAIGYSMLKTSELAKSFICLGSGRNGKSTYFDLARAILGDANTSSLTFKDLGTSFRASSLVNKLASFAADISASSLSDTDIFKNIAAGDKILVEQKYKDALDIRLFSTMFYACNKLPPSPDTTDGFYRRTVIIPFDADLSNVSTVNGMKFKRNLLSDASLEYVAYKSVLAIAEVMNNSMNFIEPIEVTELKERYKIINSSILSWFHEVIQDVKKLKNMTMPAAYLSYQTWCEEASKRKVTRQNFEDRVRTEIGYTFPVDKSQKL